jgi:hypothetical protein
MNTSCPFRFHFSRPTTHADKRCPRPKRSRTARVSGSTARRSNSAAGRPSYTTHTLDRDRSLNWLRIASDTATIASDITNISRS